jgi:hypothetical protein
VGSLDLEGSGTKMDPYTISDVLLLAANPGTVYSGELYWVKGYVLGAAKKSGSSCYGVCDNDNTSLVLAKTAEEGYSDNKIVTVELKDGDARNALNVVNNPELIGQMVKVRGTLLNSSLNPNYLGKPGVRGVQNNDQYVRPWDQDEAEIYDPTGLEEATNDQSPMTNKIIKDNQVLILRGDKTYTLQGQEVK